MMERKSRERNSQMRSDTPRKQPRTDTDNPDSRSTSPTFPDFDEEICLGLEDVGKELDRFTQEVSMLNGDDGESWLENNDETAKSSEESENLVMPILLSSNRHQERDLNQIGGQNRATQSTPQSSDTEKRNTVTNTESKEYESKTTELKALESLMQKLSSKVKLFTKQKKNLFAHKCTLLSYMPQNAIKCRALLEKNEELGRNIGREINSLNSQIQCVKKKIGELGDRVSHNKSGDSNMRGSFDKSGCGGSTDKLDIMKSGSGDNNNDNNNNNSFELELSDKRQNDFINELISGVVGSHSSIDSIEPLPCRNSSSNSNIENENMKENEERVEKNDFVKERLKNICDLDTRNNLGSFWCRPCDKFYMNTIGYIRHLESASHLAKIRALDVKKMVKRLPGVELEGAKNADGGKAFGVEFLHSTKVLVCELCRVVMWSREEAAGHPSTTYHLEKYKEYLQRNKVREMEFIRAKMAAFTRYCNTRAGKKNIEGTKIAEKTDRANKSNNKRKTVKSSRKIEKRKIDEEKNDRSESLNPTKRPHV